MPLCIFQPPDLHGERFSFLRTAHGRPQSADERSQAADERSQKDFTKQCTENKKSASLLVRIELSQKSCFAVRALKSYSLLADMTRCWLAG